MLKTIITDAIVSPGYEGAPALKFSEKGDAARFRIGKKVYDPKEEDNHRWINLSVKAFGPLCQRLEKMKLKEGSFVNLSGRLDEDTWEDKRTGEKHSAMVIVLDEIEYSGGSRKKEPEAAQAEPAEEPPQPKESVLRVTRGLAAPTAFLTTRTDK